MSDTFFVMAIDGGLDTPVVAHAGQNRDHGVVAGRAARAVSRAIGVGRSVCGP